MNYNKNVVIFFYTIFFTFLYLFIKKGIIYSTFGDQLWIHTFLYGNEYILENDIFGYSELNKSLWIQIIKFFTKYFSQYSIFYTFTILHHLLFFYFLFKIFDKIIPNNYIKMFLLGLIFSAPTFNTSGSGSVLRELSFIYRSTSFILIIIAFYYFLKNKRNTSILIAFFGSLMHLPTTVTYYIYIASNLQKFKKENLFILGSTVLVIFIYGLSQLNVIENTKISEIADRLINFRQSYLYISSWKYEHTITYLLFYLCLITTVLRMKVSISNLFFLFLIINIIYFVSVSIFNQLNFLQVFKYGREVPIIMIILSIQLVHLIDIERFNLKNLVILYAIFSLSIFGSIIQFLTIYIFIVIISKDFIIDKFFGK